MAAPRRYTDAQRMAMLRLYESGKKPAEIAKLCGGREGGVEAFQIPRRTVLEIVTRAVADADIDLPMTLADADVQSGPGLALLNRHIELDPDFVVRPPKHPR